jgi:peptidoglycan DL-endopeptidase LytF
MSRRDTIIIAVLVNAALLMILFATAIRNDDPTETKKSSSVQFASAPLHPAPIQDELLNEFVSGASVVAETGETLFPFEEFEIAIAPQKPIPAYVAQDSSQSTSPLTIASRPEKSDGQCVDIIVKKGDFLEKIAKANNTTVAAIMKANNLSSTQLKIGQIIKIPLTKGDHSIIPSQSSPQIIPTTTGEYYVVKEGDNPWLIASRNKINLEELLRINGLDDQKAKRLRPGDKLKIR